ncbi:hypothetical protein BDV96DRAFT_581263 [Lophiotrema nucula]|uniref:DUF6536 domain-containing protein n=1 Tax=Lophiotrema nucula TaxID=690887 RepID=A0A6A5YYD0_9PLEO|nr:hypothetical protein BDV96DRAFT_581263 [Lophiotrema nucula]
MTTLFHVFINIMSTLLLSASNYTMQVLSAPTRTACVKAHRDNRWLDVGIPSFRNLGYITMKKRLLWALLFSSSIPLHLFWNAGIFQVVADRLYDVELIAYESSRWEELSQTVGVKYVTNQEFKKIYGQRYVSEFGDVSLIVKGLGVTIDVYSMQEFIDNGFSPGPNITLPIGLRPDFDRHSMFNDLSDTGYIDAQYISQNVSHVPFGMANSTIGNGTDGPGGDIILWIQGGFARQFDGGSKIQISLAFMLIVIVCNVGKLVAMSFTLFDGSEAPLVTVGDAISAFMTEADPYTNGHCTYSKDEFLWRSKTPEKQNRIPAHLKDERDTKWKGIWLSERKSYIQTVSRPIWLSAVILCGLTPAITMTVFLASGPRNDREEYGTYYSTPITPEWGAASPETFALRTSRFDGPSTARLAFIANAPQILLSVMYLTFNGMFTCMSLAQEWNNLADDEKGLRVTNPKGEQRETYFLQLPYRWALPLNAFGGVLHWLTSQTLFLKRIDQMDKYGNLHEDESLAACGFSSLSLLVLLVAIFVLDFIAILVGILPLNVKIPFGSSCSAVISAACHSLNGAEDPTKKVKWGVVSKGSVSEGTVGNCCFSNSKVGKPKTGVRYK